MAKYKVFGIEHLEGTSRKTGKSYNMDILHVVECDPPRSLKLTGNRVDKITISRDSGILVAPPTPGSVWDIGFNRFGYPEYAKLVK